MTRLHLNPWRWSLAALALVAIAVCVMQAVVAAYWAT